MPSRLLARCERKNEPWPQSCWMMKMRTRKPAASTDSGSAAHIEMPRHRYIATMVATNPPNDVAICPRLRARIGVWNDFVPSRMYDRLSEAGPRPASGICGDGTVNAPPDVRVVAPAAAACRQRAGAGRPGAATSLSMPHRAICRRVRLCGLAAVAGAAPRCPHEALPAGAAPGAGPPGAEPPGVGPPGGGAPGVGPPGVGAPGA